VRQSERGKQARVASDRCQPVGQELNGAIDGLLTPAPALVPGAQVALVRARIVDGSFREALVLLGRKAKTQRVNDLPSDPFLDREDVLDRSSYVSDQR